MLRKIVLHFHVIMQKTALDNTTIVIIRGAKIRQSKLIGEIVLQTNQVFSVTEIIQISFILLMALIMLNKELDNRKKNTYFKKIFSGNVFIKGYIGRLTKFVLQTVMVVLCDYCAALALRKFYLGLQRSLINFRVLVKILYFYAF